MEPGAFEPVELDIGGTVEIPELELLVSCQKSSSRVRDINSTEKINKSFNTFLFNYDNVCDKIVIRPRETGDKIALFGGSGTKSLKKLFIEKRIPAHQRPRVPVIADAAGPLAIRGIGYDKRATCRPGDTTLEIEFKEKSHEE
jgi:tRNA(Ile)-lysidine synthase